MANKILDVLLNDGRLIPALGMGTSNSVTKSYEEVKNALQLGYRHVNITGSDELVGIRHAIEESGIPRHKIFITTKVHILANMSRVISNILLSLGGTYVDLYLMVWEPYEHPSVLSAAWSAMERIKKRGQAKSIGVANMGISDLSIIIETAEYFLPAINQVEFQPTYPQNDLLPWSKEQGIVTASYGPLDSLSRIIDQQRLPLVAPESTLQKMGRKYKASLAAVVLRWVYLKGVVIVTTRTRIHELESQLKMFDIGQTNDEFEAITAFSLLISEGGNVRDEQSCIRDPRRVAKKEQKSPQVDEGVIITNA